jgi:hypothetical protein
MLENAKIRAGMFKMNSKSFNIQYSRGHRRNCEHSETQSINEALFDNGEFLQQLSRL